MYCRRLLPFLFVRLLFLATRSSAPFLIAMPYPRLPSALKDVTERWLGRFSSTYSQVSPEDSEGLLEGEKNNTTRPLRGQWRAFFLARTRRHAALGGIAVLLTLLLAYAFSSRYQSNSRSDISIERNTQTLHLAIPTPDLGPELCKTILTSEVLHYSTPTLVRWEALDQDPRSSAQRRMTAVRDYLNKLVEHHGNDTVILLDSASTWFQLRPEVLLKRYYDINRRANQRLAVSFGSETMQELLVEQSVVFSASSECGLASVDAMKCARFPESPSKGKASGLDLPRYLSQDVVIGRVKDVYEIYRRAVAIVEREHDISGELAILSEIFSSQELHRSHITPKSLTWSRRFRGLFANSYSHGPLAGRNATARGQVHPDEFGIGLDYLNELSMDTSKGPESFTVTHHKNLPQDVLSSMPPFWTTTGEGLPSDKTWSDLDMFTGAQISSAPAMIRNNITDDHDALQKQWSRLWLQPFSRKLLDAYMEIPVMPLAYVVDNEGIEQVFWSTTTGEKAGAKDADGKWYGWDELCNGEELAGELFGDDLGEWKAARS